jgi:hypothetical protein
VAAQTAAHSRLNPDHAAFIAEWLHLWESIKAAIRALVASTHD